MAFNIDNFKSGGLTMGGARPSLFEISFAAPPSIALNNSAVGNKFTLLAEAAELPASSVAAVQVPYFGRNIKVAGDRTFADWTVTILNDEDFAIRAMLEKWHNDLNTLVSNVRLHSRPFAYKADNVIVTQFGKDGQRLRSYEFVGMFPTEISAIQLAWDTTNQIERFTATFSYDYWKPVAADENADFDTYSQDVEKFPGTI